MDSFIEEALITGEETKVVTTRYTWGQKTHASNGIPFAKPIPTITIEQNGNSVILEHPYYAIRGRIEVDDNLYRG